MSARMAHMARRSSILNELRGLAFVDRAAEARLIAASFEWLRLAKGWPPDSELASAVGRLLHDGQHEAAAMKLRPAGATLSIYLGDDGHRVDGRRRLLGNRFPVLTSEECASLALSITAACLILWTAKP